MSHARHEPAESVEQPSLFLPIAPPDGEASSKRPAEPVARPPDLTPASSLGACAMPYEQHLRRTDHSKNTVTCFLSDLHMLTGYLGRDTTLRAIQQAQLVAWLTYLRHDRGDQPAPKTMARRITFLKNFFGWLTSEGLLAVDPTSQIALTRPSPPLPELLFDDEVARLEAAAAEDARCAVLVGVLLGAGLKKEELMRLRPQDVDLSDEERPAIEVHFPGEAKRRRERRMELPAAWTQAYQRYAARYQPRERVFACTDRNLNYVLDAAVRRAGLARRVTLQLLRDVYAVRQLRAGVTPEALREKLGLSEEAWYETAEKYRKLAYPA
jgi:site-specific recombinase XerD